jgi:hypothetical protein
VRTDTPGYTAEIQGGNLLNGPFRTISDPQTVGTVTMFDVHPGTPMRFYVVWITRLAGRVAHVNEVRAFGP